MFVIKLRGLPWSCTTEDIVKFMEGVVICNRDEDPGKLAIYLMTNSDGRPSGEAFIQVETEVDVEAACNKNNQLMGQRYIEVFRSNPDQLDRHLNESQCNSQNWRDPVVRLRGLPYGCEKKDIMLFFDGLNTTEDGIMMVIDFSGRFNGEAFVQFGSNEDALKALDRHKQKISNRYIEVFRSTTSEMNHYGQGGGAGYMNGNQYGGNHNNDYNGYNNNNNRGGRGGFNNHGNGMRGGNNYNGRGNFNMNNNMNRNDRAKPYSRYDNNGNNYNRRSGSQDYDGGYSTNNNGRGSWNNNQRGGGRGNFNNNNNNNNMNSYNSYNSSGNNRYNNNNNGYDGGYDGDDNGNNYNFNGNNNGGYNNGGYKSGPMHGVKMRGLPFQATEKDIRDFFMPIQPTSVRILTGRDRRPTGEGEVDFPSHGDALKAMERDKKYMGKRYVELFLLSEPGNDRTPNPLPGSITPPETTMSLGSLMNKNFNSVPPQPMLPSLFTNFESYGSNSGAKPVPPPMPLKGQPPLPPMPSAADTGSTYSTNINELLMAEMAQKMFASAYTHFQASQGATGSQSNMNQYSQQPPPPPPQQQHQQRGRFFKEEKY